MIEGIVFDWDGVLVDSEPVFKKVEEALLRQAWEDSGRPGDGRGVDLLIQDLIRGMTGMGHEAALQLCRERLQLTVPLAGLVDDYHRRLETVYVESPLVPYAFDLVSRLRPHVRLAIATSSPHALVDPLLEKTGMRQFFDAVVTVDDVGGVAKPAPDVYRRAIERLELSPAACLAVEDTPVGCQAATTAGCRCIAIPRRQTVFSDFSQASQVARSLRDLTMDFLEDIDQPAVPAEAGETVALYARAQPLQHARVLLHLQREAGRSLARRRGWKVVEECADEDGGSPWQERAGLQTIFRLAALGQIQRLIIAEPAVLAAGAIDQAEIVRELAASAVKVRSIFRRKPSSANAAAMWN